MEFVQNFTLPDFQAKNFTPSISPNFNSFSKKKHKKWVKMEKFTPLAKILHSRRDWRDGQIPPLIKTNIETESELFSDCRFTVSRNELKTNIWVKYWKKTIGNFEREVSILITKCLKIKIINIPTKCDVEQYGFYQFEGHVAFFHSSLTCAEIIGSLDLALLTLCLHNVANESGFQPHPEYIHAFPFCATRSWR